MKFGIYIKLGAVKGGGGYTFGSSLLEGLKTLATHHEVVILAPRGGLVRCYPYDEFMESVATGKNRSGLVTAWLLKTRNLLLKLVRKLHFLKSVLPPGLKRRVFNPIDIAAKQNNIDLLWFLSPSIEFVRVPYLVPVWDLEPRLQPFFPEFMSYHDDDTHWIRSWQQTQTHFSRALFVITGTQFLKKKLTLLYNIPEERIRVIPFPLPAFVDEAGGAEAIGDTVARLCTRPFLFYPAQFWAHKNHVTILRALKIMLEQHRMSIDLVLTGSDQGNLSFVKKTAAGLGLQSNVHFAGFVNQAEIRHLYLNARALIYPTFFGPDNLPPLEAFALGCPVIASKLPGADEQLKDGAILVDPCDEQGFADAVALLERDGSLRQTLVTRGNEIARGWKSQDYLREVLRIADDFEKIQRNWQS